PQWRSRLERQVAVPHVGSSTVLRIEGEDLGMPFDRRLDRMRGRELAEPCGEARLRCRIERLLAEDQHLVLEQGRTDPSDRGIVEWRREVDPVDFGAEDGGERGDT